MAVDLSKTKAMSQIQNIAQKGVEQSNNKLIKDISVDLIDPNPDNQLIYTLKDIESLMYSIESNGFMGAIDVYLKPGGRYQISAGHRRFEAVKRLKMKTIPCIVSEMEDSFTVGKKLIESNLNTRVLSPIELSKSIIYYEKLLNESGFTGSINSQLATVFNRSVSTINALKSLNRLAGTIQSMAEEINFPYEAMNEAVNFSTEQQDRLAELIREHLERFPDSELSATIVKQYIGQIKQEQKLRKEREEREALRLQEEQFLASKKNVEPIININPPESVIMPDNMDDLTSSIEKIIPPQENNNTDNISVSHDLSNTHVETEPHPEPTELTKKITETKVEEKPLINNIDFEVNLYTNKLAEIVLNKQNTISGQVKSDVLRLLNEVINEISKKEV